MEVKSTQKYIIASPKKVREVVPLIRKLSPAKAYEVLPFTGKRASEKLRKVVGSALANARQKGLKEEELYFKEIQVTDGPRLKRWRAASRGMAKPYVKKLCHIRIVLAVKSDSKIQKQESVSKKESKEKVESPKENKKSSVSEKKVKNGKGKTISSK